MKGEIQRGDVVYLREVILSMWFRQQALIHLLEQKGVFAPAEFSYKLDEDLQKLLEFSR